MLLKSDAFLRGLIWLLCVGVMTGPVFSAEEIATSPVVAGFERLVAAQENQTAQAGHLLLSDLRCINCHRSDSTPVLAGPRLENLRQRVHFDHLVDWLSDPQKTKPGTTMPHLLAGKNEAAKRNDATALAHFLFSIKGSNLPETQQGSIENGQKLFHTVGCVACHAPEKNYKPEQEFEDAVTAEIKIPSVPLGNLHEKYTARGLQAFLRDPLQFRPSGHMPRTPLSNAEASDLTAYVLRGNSRKESSISVDKKLAQSGRKLFSELGCAACHELDGTQIPGFKSLAEISKKTDGGCLAEMPSKRAANYSLSPAQRQALQAALQNRENNRDASQRLQQTMLSLNCYACHSRDGFGGPEAGRAIYFQTSGADLEDEGRFPPRLTGVGRKLLPEALEQIVRGEGAIRPYMTTRMPDFGTNHAAHFSNSFANLDLTGEIKPTPRDGNEDQIGRSPWGRDLMGVKGLGCISCHDLNGQKSLGIRAVDLVHAPKRLHPEWFRDYLIDPAAFKPGTRMPSFWPEGKAIHPLLNRNTARQIDSLWVYLTEIDQNRLPEGMEEKGSFELKPTNAPIVFRTFMKDAGLHAIAVGFPEGVHAAFDAENCRWTLAWRGKFLDAEGTWDDRFAPLAQPLGTNVFKFPAGTPMPGEHQFRGYRLDSNNVPTFLYQVGTIEVEDTLKPAGQNLQRTLKLRGGSGRLAIGTNLEKKEEIEFDSQGNAIFMTEVKW